MFWSWLNNGKKIVQGLNYSLRDWEGVSFFLQAWKQSSDPQTLEKFAIFTFTIFVLLFSSGEHWIVEQGWECWIKQKPQQMSSRGLEIFYDFVRDTRKTS